MTARASATRPRARSSSSRPRAGSTSRRPGRPIPRVAEVPFDAEYKLMATFHEMDDGGRHGRALLRQGRARRAAGPLVALPRRRRHRRRRWATRPTRCWPRTTGWRARACACWRSPGATSTRPRSTRRATCWRWSADLRAARPRRHRRPAAQGGQGRHRPVQGRRHPRPHDHRRPRHHGRGHRRPARHRGPGAHRRRVRRHDRRRAARRGRRASASSPGSRPRTRCAWSASSSSRATSSP